jgi:hypothetical protein
VPTLKIAIDAETYRRLSASAVRELRPIPWHALVLLRRALGIPCPVLEEANPPLGSMGHDGGSVGDDVP